MAVAHILLGFLACGATAVALGLTALRLLRIELRRAEAVCLGFVLGSALTSTLTLAIAALWIAREGAFLGIAAVALVLLWRQRKWLRRLPPASMDGIPKTLQVVFAAAWLAFGTVYFRQALSPEMSPDGMSYHLGLVNLWNHAHGLIRNNGMFAAMPEGLEMLFLFAFAIGRHSAAALVHFSFLMSLPLLTILYGCRFGWQRGGAVLAAILVFASPLVAADGAAAYNDVALAAIVFAAVYLLELWRRERTTGTLLAASLLAGFAFAVKYTGGPLLLFAAGTIVWEQRRTPRRQAAKALLLALAAMALTPAPYLIRNAIWFQDPIAFFGNGIFRNRWFHVSFEQELLENMSHWHGVTWSEAPRELTLGGPKTGESFGPAFVIMPLALIGLAWPQTRLLLAAAAFSAFGFAGDKNGRLLIPAVPLLAMAAAYVLCRFRRAAWLAGGIAVAHLFISWPAMNTRLHIYSGWRLMHIPWKVALRQEPEDEYLGKDERYTAARLIEARVPEGQPVFLFAGGSVAQSYTTRPILVAWESAFAERIADSITDARNSADFERRRWTAGFPKTAVREILIVQTGSATGRDMWSIDEIRLWDQDRLLPHAPGWRLNAFPNPWDIALAFDGSAATRWRSWEWLRPGMWIDVRLDPAQELDHVDILCNDGQWDSRMAAFVLTSAGQWELPGLTGWHMDPPADLRREAMAAIQRAGIRYIAVSRQRWEGEPFRGDSPGWGVRQIGSTRDLVLLEVE
ncbi:MAG: glycosyltransferase family 39 protein [Bryobacteraceae bacterium]|jgi:4-amino-4-deoxy-L-arabinose transferase-like glycosyltransferase